MECTDNSPAIRSPDWNAIRESYLQGLPPDEIAQTHRVSLYALNQQVTRHGWATVRSQARSIARQEFSERIKNSLTASIMRDSVMFERFEMPPPDTEQHEIASRNRARLIESAAKLLGWNEVSDATLDVRNAKVIDV